MEVWEVDAMGMLLPFGETLISLVYLQETKFTLDFKQHKMIYAFVIALSLLTSRESCRVLDALPVIK